MIILILALLSGVVGGLIVAAVPKANNRIRNLVVLIFTAMGTIFSWRIAKIIFSGGNIKIGGEFGGLAWSIAPDPLGVLFGLIVSTLWLFAAVYSFGYMEGKHKQGTYYTFFLLSLSATLGVAFSGNLVALYLFYELLTFATYPLVIHERSPEAIKAGSKYIVYSLSGAGAILIAIVITYNLAGNQDFINGPILAKFLQPEYIQLGYLKSGLNWLLLLFVKQL